MPAPTKEASFLSQLAQLPRETPPSRIFKRIEKVGQGAYGSVYKAAHVPTSFIVALKIIDLDTEGDDTAEIQREVGMLQSMTRNGDAEKSNVTRYFGCWMEGPKVWIVMDYAGGGSVRTLRKAGPIEERFILLIVREVLVALSYLNRVGIIHRDIKAANILLTDAPRITLCDFGVSAPLFLSSSATSKRTTFVGTPFWMAPEVMLGQPYDTKADIWGLGITVLEIADRDGEPPHAREDPMRAIMMIPKMKPPTLPTNEPWSKEMRDFLAGALNERPDERMSADDLMKTKWIKSGAKLPLAPLSELLRRMDAWKERGNKRTSMAVSVYGGPDEFGLDGDSDDDWQFNTFRASDGQPFELGSPSSSSPSSPKPSTVPLAQPQRAAPKSLRSLFEDDSAPAAIDPFGAGPNGRGASPAPGGFLLPASYASSIASSGDSGEDSRTNTVRAPPPRLVEQQQQQTLSAQQLPEEQQPPPRRPGAGRMRSDSDAFAFSNRVDPHPESPKPSILSLSTSGGFGSGKTPLPPPTLPFANGLDSRPSSPSGSYRDVRNSKGLANIAIPPPQPFANNRLEGARTDSPIGLTQHPLSSGGPGVLLPEGSSPGRGRSASHAQADETTPFQATFGGPPSPDVRSQYHQPSASLDSASTHGGAGTTSSRRPSGLQPSTSSTGSFLDEQPAEHHSPSRAVHSGGHVLGTGSGPSARRPSVGRQASLAVMETVAGSPHPPLPLRSMVQQQPLAPPRPGIAGRARSNSRIGGDDPHHPYHYLHSMSGGLSPLPIMPTTPISPNNNLHPSANPNVPPVPSQPALKDVLKLLPVQPSEFGQDLLPPSPSVAHASASRFGGMNGPSASSPLGNGPYSLLPGASMSTPSLEPPSSFIAPPLPVPISSSSPATASMRRTSFSASSSSSAGATRPTSPLPPPPPIPQYLLNQNQPLSFPNLYPLDYSRLETSHAVHAELTRTVDELAKWLEVVEGGLTGLLDSVATAGVPASSSSGVRFEQEAETAAGATTTAGVVGDEVV